MDYHSGLKRGYTGSFTLASLVRNVKTVKTFCPVCNGALKADTAIAYCTHKNCGFGNAVPCSSVIKIAVSQQIYGFSAPNLLQWFIRRYIFIIHS